MTKEDKIKHRRRFFSRYSNNLLKCIDYSRNIYPDYLNTLNK